MATIKTLIGNIKGKDGIANVYSPSEIEIGTWNGSTLYRKMIKVNIPNTNVIGNCAKGTYLSGISYEKIKSVYINEIRASNFVWSTAGFSDRSNGLVVYAGGTNICIENYDPFNNGVSCYIVIEYIK